MNNFEMEYDDEEQFSTVKKLRDRLNNLGKIGLDFIISDLNDCHNTESALTLETLTMDDTIISIPINGFKYCYTIKELIDLIENAMNKYELANPGQDSTINDITINDLYTNVKISSDILQKVYNYYNGIIEVDTIEKIFAETFTTYPDEIDELEDFMIELIQNNKNLIIGSTYDLKIYIGFNKMTPLQRACDRNLTKVAMYILNNFTPKECLLNYVDNNERTALMYAINSIYKNSENIRSMNKVTIKILEYNPDENNLFYIGGDLHDNKTALMIACHKGLTDIALKILERKPLIDYVNVRSPPSEYNLDALYYEESTEGKTAIDYAVRNDMEPVLNKLVEMYGPSMKRERKSDMYSITDDLYGYDSRLLEFEPRGHLGGKVMRFKRKSSKKHKSRKRLSKRISKK